MNLGKRKAGFLTDWQRAYIMGQTELNFPASKNELKVVNHRRKLKGKDEFRTVEQLEAYKKDRRRKESYTIRVAIKRALVDLEYVRTYFIRELEFLPPLYPSDYFFPKKGRPKLGRPFSKSIKMNCPECHTEATAAFTWVKGLKEPHVTWVFGRKPKK